MSDGSMATMCEDWIVGQLAAIEPFLTGGAIVEPYRGSTVESGARLIEELLGERSVAAAVVFEGGRALSLEEGQNRYDATYGVYVAVKNERKAAARRGDDTAMGTNALRDVMRIVLHNQFPGVSANGFATDDARFNDVQVMFQREDAFIMRAEVQITESPL